MHTNGSESALTWMSSCCDKRQRLSVLPYSPWQRFSFFSIFSFFFFLFFFFGVATKPRKKISKSLAVQRLSVRRLVHTRWMWKVDWLSQSTFVKVLLLCILYWKQWLCSFLPIVFALLLFSRIDSRIFIKLHLSPSVMRFCLTPLCICWYIIFISWSSGTPGERRKNVKNVIF